MDQVRSSVGTLRVSGSARDVAGTGNRLSFELREFDQTDLPGLIRTLEEPPRLSLLYVEKPTNSVSDCPLRSDNRCPYQHP